MITDEIRAELYHLQDIKYRDFQSKLIPTVSPDYFIGVRTPELRKLAKQVGRRDDVDSFLAEKDYTVCLESVDRFLPYIDNWATCDQMSPKVFRKHREELLEPIRRWVESGETYTIRFGIGMLMEHFLDEDFAPEYPEMVAAIRTEEYYVNMMVAWYFATALAKQYEAVLPFLEDHRLDTWTHNKTIRKAVESYRISPEQKEYLRSLKVKGGSGG